MKNKILFFLIFISVQAKSQYSRYIIELTNKQGTTFSLANPSAFLSEESIARKKRYNISIDSIDLPVNSSYLDSIKKSGNVEILNVSKWLNQVLIKTTDQNALNKISKFSFVKKKYPIAKRSNEIIDKSSLGHINNSETSLLETFEYSKSPINYGSTGPQIMLHEGEYMHEKGLQGQGIKIAVFDAGFFKYQNLTVFDSLRQKQRINGTWDFVERNSSVNEDDIHGMWCLSILAGNLPGTYVGSAPQSNYYLFRTEDAFSEYPVEEQNWAAAAEKADSLGVDIITSSLGYSEFDDASFNHTYADMNGLNTTVSKAAAIAIKKGMIVTNSAGNEGNKKWKYIIAPADVKDVLTVGAINISKEVAPFSSYGPAANGRVKPDVTSVGWNTFLINSNGAVSQGNGTSFSNPNIAGLVACLWQAYPEFTNIEIINAVRQSADHFSKPDDRTGYGIPNFRIAYTVLDKERQLRKVKEILKADDIKVFPNPISDRINVAFKNDNSTKIDFALFSMDGKLIKSYHFDLNQNEFHLFNLEQLESLPSGQYILTYNNGLKKGSIRILK
jgi:subtilisin family serine protease